MHTTSQALSVNQTLNQQLQSYGYHLRAEDMTALKQSVQHACSAFDLVESGYHILYELIKALAASPYADATRYLPMLHDAIFSYYQLRSLFSWQVNDATILHTLLTFHMQYGTFDKVLIKRCCKQLKIRK